MPALARRAALAALATAILPAAAAHAKPAPHLLVVRSVAVGTTTAPVVVHVRTPPSVRLTVRVNGRERAGVFGAGATATRVGTLTRRDGLRAGRNTIRIDARRANGDADREVRTVTLAAASIAPDAGPDRTVAAGRGVRVGATALRSSPGTTYRWRVVQRPRGATARLRGAASARPVLRTDRAGTYALRVTTTTGGDAAHDTVLVHGRPDDPPDGVAIETLSTEPGGAIRIDGRGLADTADGNGIHIAIVERRTRDVRLAATAPRGASGLQLLLSQVRALDGETTDFLVVLSGTQGIGTAPNDLDAFAALARRLGGRLDATQTAALKAGGPFSLIGVTNSPEGSAWIDVPATAPSAITTAAANLTGRLRLGAASDRYDYVSTTFPDFDTSVPVAEQGVNQIIIGQTPHNTKLDGSTAALHVLVLDANSLHPLYEGRFATDGGDVHNLHAAIARKLREWAELPGRPLVIVQTLGTPRGNTPEWAEAARQIERLGGNPRIFNALDGTQRYTLVGRLGELQAVAESSTVTGGSGRIAGRLARGRDGGFLPLPGGLADPTNGDLIGIVNRPAQPFPAFTGGQLAAEAYIGVKLGFCPAGSNRCDLRQRYWKNYRSDWDSKFTTLSSRVRYTAGAGFTPDEFAKVKETLLDEIEALGDVKTYFDGLLAPFGRAGTRGLVDLKALSTELSEAIQPPPATNATSNTLGLISKIVAVPAAAFAPLPPVAAALGGVSAALGLASFVTQERGTPAGGEVTARADRLASELLDRLDEAQENIAGLALLVVSDHGRMMAVEDHVDRDWVVEPSDARVLAGIRLALKQWIAEALVPVAYPTLIRATPFGAGGPSNVRLLDCGGRTPFNQPDSGQLRAMEGFNASGTPIQPWYFFTHYFTSPKDHLTEYLFNAQNAPTPGLGIQKLEFLTPRVFGRFWLADHGAKNCDLPW